MLSLRGADEKIFLPKNLHISKKSSNFAADYVIHKRDRLIETVFCITQDL